jgi:prepilin-type processing-associated H-X9-DG protein
MNSRSTDDPLGIGMGPYASHGRREHEIANAADMVVLGEMNETEIGGTAISNLPPNLQTDFAQNFPFNRNYGYYFLFRHNQRANALFGDGHVETPNRDGLIGSSDTVRRRWDYDDQPHDENWR